MCVEYVQVVNDQRAACTDSIKLPHIQQIVYSVLKLGDRCWSFLPILEYKESRITYSLHDDLYLCTNEKARNASNNLML